MDVQTKINNVRNNMIRSFNNNTGSDGLLAPLIMALPLVQMSDQMVEALKASHGFATMATDGTKIYYSEEFVESLTQKELLFVFAHEVYHVVLSHVDRAKSLNRQPMLWNMAGDYVINAYLKKANVGEMPEKCLYDPKYDGMSTDEVYLLLHEEVSKNGDPQGGEGEGEGGQGTGNFDQHLDPSKMSEEEKEAFNKAKAAIDATVEAALKTAGDRVLGEVGEWYADLHEAKVDWREEIRAELSGLVNDDMSFNRIHRWTGNLGGACLPTPTPSPMVRVSFGIDTSGSMGQQMLSDIMSEVVGVTEQFGCFEIDIWCFDTEIHNPQSYTHEDGDAPTHYKLAGGGGTIFQTNWDYMKEVYEEPPELFILLTDGYDCSTIEDTDYCDTIFLVHSNPSYKEPFGKTIKYESDM